MEGPVTHDTPAGSSAAHQAADARLASATGASANSPVQHKAAAHSPAAPSAAAGSPTGQAAGTATPGLPAVPAASPISTGQSDVELASPMSDTASGPVMWYNGAVSDAEHSDASQATTSHAMLPDASPVAAAGNHPWPDQQGTVPGSPET